MERLSQIITWIAEARETPAEGYVDIAKLSDDDLGALAAALDELPKESRALAATIDASLADPPSNDALEDLLVDLDVRLYWLLDHWKDLTRMFPTVGVMRQLDPGWDSVPRAFSTEVSVEQPKEP